MRKCLLISSVVITVLALTAIVLAIVGTILLFTDSNSEYSGPVLWFLIPFYLSPIMLEIVGGVWGIYYSKKNHGLTPCLVFGICFTLAYAALSTLLYFVDTWKATLTFCILMVPHVTYLISSIVLFYRVRHLDVET